MGKPKSESDRNERRMLEWLNSLHLPRTDSGGFRVWLPNERMRSFSVSKVVYKHQATDDGRKAS